MTDRLGLAGSTAVVTGTGGGIGRGVAPELARAGAHVAVLDLDPDGARETAASIAAESGAAGGPAPLIQLIRSR